MSNKVSSKMLLGEGPLKIQGLQRLAERDLPVRVAYKVARILKLLGEEAKAYDEQRVKLIKKYATKDEKGELVVENGEAAFAPEQRALFDKEFRELNTSEITLESQAILVDDFRDVQVSSKELVLLGDFLVEEIPEDSAEK